MQNLVIQTAYLGDILLAIPLLKRVKDLDPKLPLSLFCRKGFGELFVQLKLVDGYVEVDKRQAKSWGKALSQLKRNQYNMVISPHQSFRTALIVRQLKANKKIGFKSFRTFWAYDEKYERPTHWPDALRQISLLRGVDSVLNAELEKLQERKSFFNDRTMDDLKTPIPNFASMSLRRLILESDLRVSSQLSDKYICIAPGSVWATKRYPVESYAKLAKSLSQKGLQVVVLGSPDEVEIAKTLSDQVPNSLNLCGKTSLLESLKVLANAKVLICNDSGAQHMAAVADTPVVSIFGPTTLDLGYRAWVSPLEVVQLDLKCRPCGQHGSQQCPLGTHECMKSLDYSLVESAVLNISNN